ncbi:hypothetical protein C8Q79DRAFT_1009322 [Trametes meyenii]|nr:hypothetical protein C8Q79DRAFT_1009322 [Trametes meyenii]
MDGIRSPAVVMLSSIRLNNSLAVASVAMLYYDYCLTFSMEVERFWRSARLSPVSILFVLNRYLGLLGPVPVLVEYLWNLSPQRYHQYYAVISQVIVGVILIMRTYAFYDRNKRLLTALLGFGATLTIFTILMTTRLKTWPTGTPHEKSDSIDIGACDLSLTVQQGLRPAIGWICMLAVDTVIFMLTLFKTIRMRETFRQHSLLQVLFRDGSIYYGILVIANIVNILTFLMPTVSSAHFTEISAHPKQVDDSNRGLATTPANALATTLVSRMFLNLRNPHLRPGAHLIGQPSQWSLPNGPYTHPTEHGETRRRPSALYFDRPVDCNCYDCQHADQYSTELEYLDIEGVGRAL